MSNEYENSNGKSINQLSARPHDKAQKYYFAISNCTCVCSCLCAVKEKWQKKYWCNHVCRIVVKQKPPFNTYRATATVDLNGIFARNLCTRQIWILNVMQMEIMFSKNNHRNNNLNGNLKGKKASGTPSYIPHIAQIIFVYNTSRKAIICAVNLAKRIKKT